MTKKEMLDAMLAGKTLISGDCKAWYDPEHKDGPFLFMSEDLLSALYSAWEWSNWKIQGKRTMTREEVLGFLTNTPGVLVRSGGNEEWYLPGGFTITGHVEEYEWASVSADGHIGEPHKFEKEE